MLSRLSSTTALGLMLATAFTAAQAPQAPAPQTDSSTPPPEVTFKVEVNYRGMATSSLHFIDGVPRCPSQTT